MTLLRAVIWAAVSTKKQTEDERDSLPAQERDALTLCEREGWQVVELLRVPGHSRRFTDIHECAASMRKKGINAFDRLIDLWETKGFDVLICKDGNRFARTQSLFARVVEDTINAGARIYSLADGWVEPGNYRFWIAMYGYRAASEIDKLTADREMGLNKRVARGLHPAGPPFSHIYIRDDKGKPVKLVPNEKVRLLILDTVKLLLDDTPWYQMGDRLQDWGYVDPKTGDPLEPRTLHRLFYDPFFWGHAARKYKNVYGVWAFDENAPKPPDVIIHRNTHEPYLSGELAEQVKAELVRRDGVNRGRTRPEHDYWFTGLLRCDECGYAFTVAPNSGYPHWRCTTYFRSRKGGMECSQHRILNNRAVFRYIDGLFTQCLEREIAFNPAQTDMRNRQNPSEIDLIRHEIEDLRRQANEAITHLLAETDASIKLVYTGQVDRIRTRLKTLEDRLAQEQSRGESALIIENRARTWQELADMGLPQFWQLEGKEINRRLHRIFGKYRLFVRRGKIVRIDLLDKSY